MGMEETKGPPFPEAISSVQGGLGGGKWGQIQSVGALSSFQRWGLACSCILRSRVEESVCQA